MKIEKINENQIRCTLTREDLASRQIKISELAYGSEKAKELFRDMMQQALRDCGFEAGNTPLMIEAVPTSPDSMILIITKVDDPEELDSRFSRFSPEDGTSPFEGKPTADLLSGADDVLDLISRLRRSVSKDSEPAAANATPASSAESAAPSADRSAAAGTDKTTDKEPENIYHLTRFYLFRDLETVMRAGHVIGSAFAGPSSLYKNEEDGTYFLILKKGETSARQFNRICNTISEYAAQADYQTGMEEYFTEHLTVILKDRALDMLGQL